MGRFNTKEKTMIHRKPDTRAYEGELAFTHISPETELVSLVATSFIVDKYYENEGKQLLRLQQLTQKVLETDPEFIWKLAVFARDQWHMRSVSHVLAGEAVEHFEGRKFTKEYLNQVIQRPDDAAEIMAYWMSIHRWVDADGITRIGGKNQMPRALRSAMQEFFRNLTEYHARKYAPKLARRQLSLVDLLRIIHPDPKIREDGGMLYKALVEGNLSPADTWEVKVSAAGSNPEDKAKAWMDSIPNMGYMAKLRNLRNFEAFQIYSKEVVDHLTDQNAIRNSKQLPYRFMSAYNEIESVVYKEAIRTALLHSFENLQVSKGRVLIAIDSSGSMTWAPRPSKPPIEHAAILGAVLAYAGMQSKDTDVEVVMFDSNLQTVDLFDKGPIAIYQYIRQHAPGGATYGHLVLKYAMERPAFDYIIYLTDMQFHFLWDTQSREYGKNGNRLIDKYRTTKNRDMRLVFMDIQGYDKIASSQDSREKIYMISGFSEKVFEYIQIMDDPLALVKLVKQYSPEMQA